MAHLPSIHQASSFAECFTEKESAGTWFFAATLFCKGSLKNSIICRGWKEAVSMKYASLSVWVCNATYPPPIFPMAGSNLRAYLRKDANWGSQVHMSPACPSLSMWTTSGLFIKGIKDQKWPFHYHVMQSWLCVYGYFQESFIEKYFKIFDCKYPS